MSKLAPGYELRPATAADLDAVAAVEAAYDIADYGRPYVDKGWIAEEWTKPRFDPTHDAWVVVSPIGDVIAYAQLYEEEPGVLVEGIARVHPAHTRLGLGSALLLSMEGRASELATKVPDGGSIKFVNVLSATDEPARRLLHGAGYAIDRHFWHMELDLTAEIGKPQVPAGYELRRFDLERDQEAVYGVLSQAFAGHYGYPATPTPYAEWQAELGTPSYASDLWIVATQDGAVVGALTRRELMGEGWVQELGVLLEHRGRGLGAALLTRAFDAFKAEGFTTAALNVDAANETGATALYERVGMKVRRRWDLYRKMLPHE